MEQRLEPQPLDAALHVGQTQQRWQAVADRADEQRGEQVTKEVGQRQGDGYHLLPFHPEDNFYEACKITFSGYTERTNDISLTERLSQV